MKLLFNLKYVTTFGEELVLNVMNEDGSPQKQYRMTTQEGQEWQTEISIKDKELPPSIDYYYTVERNGTTARREWGVEPHRLLTELISGQSTIVIYDRWIDIPEDAPLYTSAFTQNFDEKKTADKALDKMPSSLKNVILKVRAPQLRPNERLAVLGDAPALGSWEALKAKEMEEQQPHEWVLKLDVSAFTRPLFEFKFVALDEQKDVTPLWEEGCNRTLILPDVKETETVVYELEQANMPIYPWKGAGTVIPVFSLRSEGSFGVGDFGDLKTFIDWIALTGQRILQVLPINDTTITHTWQDSYPYNSISIYALHPQYTDLRQLPQLKDEERRDYFATLQKELNKLPQIDYERVNNAKIEYLKEVYLQEWKSISQRKDYKAFLNRNRQWLIPYAVFCHCRDLYGTATFSEWSCEVKVSLEEGKVSFIDKDEKAKTQTLRIDGPALNRELGFWYFVQYNLDCQMRGAHLHARSKHVILKGDIPIGISRDGVEAWMEPRYFNLNGQAGAPPDAFSRNGQNWGFPTYNWDEMLADGCSWWVRRFRKMAEYFDAYRIDHVLGFFRIWEIPIDAVHGLLGQFSPALAMSREEIEGYGLHFQEELFTKPYIRDWVLERIFGDRADMVKKNFLNHLTDEVWEMKKEFNTQKKVEAWYRNISNAKAETDSKTLEEYGNLENLRDGLYALISDVLFVRDRKNPNRFHPRIGVQLDFIYESLYDNDKFVFNRLYNDYFYRRNNQFWYGEAMKKLPLLTQATRMMVCAEDLGMVPDCVPWVMNELRILSLEIQSMPKDNTVRFGHLSRNPYCSVCTISTHDMSTLRQWWDEDYEQTQSYYNTMLYRPGAAPHPLPAWLAKDIVSRHLTSPSMLCLLSFQDWMAIDEKLRLEDADAERINIPANPRHYWRYRMHLSIEQLLAADELNNNIRELISHSGRR